MEKVNSPLIEWGVASRSLRGQEKCGDLSLVKLSSEEALVAVVDGVGHGEAAAEVAQMAIECLGAGNGEPLAVKLRHCHEALRRTRGVAASLASFRASDNMMSWLGVGNVEGVLVRARSFEGRVGLALRGGLVGDHLPSLAPHSLRISKGDVLIFATDGVQPGFRENADLIGRPQQIAERILARHNLGTDDALVLAVRYIYGKDQGPFR